jgi:hypothetical protein
MYKTVSSLIPNIVAQLAYELDYTGLATLQVESELRQAHQTGSVRAPAHRLPP